MAKYYTMMVKEPGGEWAPEFGDYSRALVADEMRCAKNCVGYGYGFVKGTKFKLVATGEKQAEIEAAVAKLINEDAIEAAMGGPVCAGCGG
jgi:hypothetical protein